jgi:Tfp pilus assembly protein PilV
MNKWSHLPNAKHIDWILASLQANPEKWRDAYIRVDAWNDAMNATWNAASDTIWNAARNASWAAWKSAVNAVGMAAWDGADGAIGALIAYNDCEKYLTMTPDELRVQCALTEDPACILLLPMVTVLQCK